MIPTGQGFEPVLVLLLVSQLLCPKLVLGFFRAGVSYPESCCVADAVQRASCEPAWALLPAQGCGMLSEGLCVTPGPLKATKGASPLSLLLFGFIFLRGDLFFSFRELTFLNWSDCCQYS